MWPFRTTALKTLNSVLQSHVIKQRALDSSNIANPARTARRKLLELALSQYKYHIALELQTLKHRVYKTAA